MGAPREVVELAERFDQSVEAYRAGRISEESTKVGYINPLFEALGWGVRDAREVVFEDSVKVGGGTKAPDYGFYLGDARKFSPGRVRALWRGERRPRARSGPVTRPGRPLSPRLSGL